MIGPGIVKVAIPGAAVALLATGSAVAFPDETPQQNVPTASSPLQLKREAPTSRDALRPPLDLTLTQAPKPKAKATPVAKHLKKQAPIPRPTSIKTRAAESAKTVLPPKITGSKYTTTDVNLWSAPVSGSLLTVLEKGTKVSVTGKIQGAFAEVVNDGVSRWVKAQYLAATKPVDKPATEGSSSQAPCKSGSSVEDGLTPDAIRVHRAICNLFPSVTSYGGLRSGDSGSEHSSGRGLDIMVTGQTGQEIADWLRANRKAMGVSELIWEQKIWTVERSSEGWRSMEDRGGDTANHVDHVHVSVYGNSGTA
ncbi:SH3 domain-containing protein [Kribbella sp. CA-293567]|uniref:SH3 domain-containing protein n=1 Tax=Kribbella sp. CA-293567 TaxID=3002436 RepID=UPI0022DE23E1|nr:SH3 domain-containing protein [Kribbella sp. CA-293567]WBQ05241.1 SH3 domain-containing protein [Kribbella sp. CA-293567]